MVIKSTTIFECICISSSEKINFKFEWKMKNWLIALPVKNENKIETKDINNKWCVYAISITNHEFDTARKQSLGRKITKTKI